MGAKEVARDVRDKREIERILKALANRRRLAVLHFLNAKGPTSVGDIAEHIKLSFAATSRHLRTLANADLVETEQRSTVVFYSLPKRRPVLLATVLREM
jgi:DNA-binding transcriptional ArsR family regulator